MTGSDILTPLAAIFVLVVQAGGVQAGGAARAAEPPRLSLPIACEPGRTCFVQNHVDLDPGPGTRDFACEAATYDGHKGVDFRLLSAAVAVENSVAVQAAAPGKVKGTRDGMADQFAREGGGLAGRECGNGVVVDHGGGWETQYCHMRRGSVAVRTGQQVSRGERLGDVGYSGFADFAHLHFEVRKDGDFVDPFSMLGAGAACLRDGATATGLWEEAAARAFPYRRGQFIESGFASAIPNTLALEQGAAKLSAAGPEGDGLIFYARVMNARAGDRIRLRVTGPAGFATDVTSEPFDRNKAIAVQAAGKKRTRPRWASGSYDGIADLLRGDAVVDTVRGRFEMP